MAKPKMIFTCNHCASQHNQWQGQCQECGAWNSLQEQRQIKAVAKHGRAIGYAGEQNSKVYKLNEVELQQQSRIPIDIPELDRVLGGGLVYGSVVLIGGDPGIGKSTLLLQTLCNISQHHKSLYVTGEESLQQVTMRAKRLSLSADKLLLLAETQVERIIEVAINEKPQVIVIDSIQTIFTDGISSAPGGVSQVREAAAQLVQFAKQMQIAIFLVGHVTKDGSLAGPRVLEHMVDAVLYFEGERDGNLRMIRAIKNRFGAVNELGVFAMTERGLREISNPSAIFLSRNCEEVSGSIVMVTWEGTRPLLVEVQALVTESHLANPRRVCVGLEQNRLAMLLAVLHRHGGVVTYDQDVFINVVGGVRVSETAADLAIALAVLSSLRDKVLPRELIVFGEVGLAGEIRPVQSGQPRLKEAAKHGFKHAIVPIANMPKQQISGMQVIGVQHIVEALQAVKDL